MLFKDFHLIFTEFDREAVEGDHVRDDVGGEGDHGFDLHVGAGEVELDPSVNSLITGMSGTPTLSSSVRIFGGGVFEDFTLEGMFE